MDNPILSSRNDGHLNHISVDSDKTGMTGWYRILPEARGNEIRNYNPAGHMTRSADGICRTAGGSRCW